MSNSGPRPGSRCTICRFDRVAEVDAELSAGNRSQAAIARAYGLERQTVGRHVAHSHVMPTRGAPRPAAPPLPGDDDSPVAVMKEALRALREMDPSRLSPAAVVARLDAIRRTAESISKMEVPIRQRVGINEVEGLPALIARWVQVLERFPDARQAMLEVTPSGLAQEVGDAHS